MAKHVTMRGDPIDMQSLMARHADQVALGNARMNAGVKSRPVQ